MSEALPARPDINWLKNRAKDALARLRADRPAARLAAAQLSVARQYGFASWRKLKSHVEALRSSGSAETLFDAVRRGDLPSVRRILGQSRQLASARTDAGETLLHLAVEHGSPKLVELLLEHGVDPSVRYGRSAHTALSWAVVVGAFAAAKVLIKAGVKPDLFCAAGLGELAVVRSFFDRDGNPRPAASQTGSTRYDRDGNVLPCPPQAGLEVISDALYLAARHGRLKVVRYLLQRGADVSFRAYMGGTPLHWAHFSGSFLTVKELLDAGANPNLRDDVFNATPREFGIMVPANWGIADNVDCQIRHDRALARLQTDRGTPLHEAARGGHAVVAMKLLKAGADPSAVDAAGKTALDLARGAGHSEVAHLLESAAGGRRPRAMQNLGWKPIMDAAFAGDAPKVKKLIAAGADPNVLSKTAHRYRPLHRAIEHKKTLPKTAGHEEVVKVLLESGADPKLPGTHAQVDALNLAASSETRFVPLLLKHFGELDIFHACIVLDEPRVKSLISRQPALARDADASGWTPLHWCAGSAMFKQSPEASATQLRIARMLVGAGADVAATYPFDGKWPIPVLYFACGWHNNPALTELLMDAGASPFDGESIYHAADEGHAECLAIFERRCDRRALAAECTKVLPTLMWWGRSRAAGWLLKHGADPNAQHAESGNPPLHTAVIRGMNEQVIDLLLQHGADPHARNRDGRTALQLAKSSRNSRILRQLQRSPAAAGPGGRRGKKEK